MFNEIKFRQVLLEEKLTISDIAKHLGISTVTLYRKMSGESDFYRAEIYEIKKLFKGRDVSDIFFADAVA